MCSSLRPLLSVIIKCSINHRASILSNSLTSFFIVFFQWKIYHSSFVFPRYCKCLHVLVWLPHVHQSDYYSVKIESFNWPSYNLSIRIICSSNRSIFGQKCYWIDNFDYCLWCFHIIKSFPIYVQLYYSYAESSWKWAYIYLFILHKHAFSKTIKVVSMYHN